MAGKLLHANSNLGARSVTPVSMSDNTAKPPQTIVVSDCDRSTTSWTTLLSSPTSASWMADEDDVESETEYEKLVRSFAQRNKILNHICKGRNIEYTRMIRRNEEMVRQEAFKIFEREQGKGKSNVEDQTTSVSTWASAVWSTVVFDCHHTSQAGAVLLCYCAAHLAIYEAVASLVFEYSRTIVNQDAVFLGLILGAIFLSRLCGGLWYFSSDPHYLAAKFDLHNRLRLHLWDAKILRWFIHNPKIKFFIDYLAVYLALIGVSYFQVKFLGILDQRGKLVANLPSAEYGVTTIVTERLLQRSHSQNNTDACLNDRMCALLEFHRDLLRKDEMFVWDRVGINSYAGLMGENTAKAMSQQMYFTFYFIFASASIAVMTWLGFAFE